MIRKISKAPWAAVEDAVDGTATTIIESTIDRVTSDGLLESIPTKVEVSKKFKHIIGKITNKTKQGQTLLGQMLFLAAALAEAMDAHTDEKLIEKYLTATPPLHPRRTLDQSYYWTLKDTRKRDRDQVVYRGTAPNPKFMHHKCFKGRKVDNNVKETCRQCKEDVRKVPRVVMVDQLWMWVLDESKPESHLISQSVQITDLIHRYNHYKFSQAMGPQQARPFGGTKVHPNSPACCS